MKKRECPARNKPAGLVAEVLAVAAVRRFPSIYDDALGAEIASSAPPKPFPKLGNVGRHFFVPTNGTGVRVPPWHLPLPVLLPVTRPEASRRVLVMVPWVVSLPVIRPEASRNWVWLPVLPSLLVLELPVSLPLPSRNVVRELPPELAEVVAEPVIRPLASRYWVRAVLPPTAWVVAVPRIRPEASRITARSVPPACFWR